MTVSAPPSSPGELAALEARIDAWVVALPAQGMAVGGIERIDDPPRSWYVRMDGEEKTNFSIIFTLGQRTLFYESYFMPGPAENHAEVLAQLLARNLKLYGLSFGIGKEDAIYLTGQLANGSVTEDELDRILGSIYLTTEQCFRPAMRLGFESQFRG